MKSILKFFFILVIVVLFSIGGFGQAIKVDCNGNVAIGTDPGTYKFRVFGTSYFRTNSDYDYYLLLDNTGYFSRPCLHPYSNGSCNIGQSNYAYQQVWSFNYYNPSDLRLKENIRIINNALDIVLQMEGVRYDLKSEVVFNDSTLTDEELKSKIESDRKDKIGFIAQDVKRVLPEVISYDEANDKYGIDYSKVVPVLVNAIKEQQAQIDSLKQLMTRSSETLKSTGFMTGIGNFNNVPDQAYLEQNSPNPFSSLTTIKYYLPEKSQKSSICVYDMQGLQKKVYSISSNGKSEITINSFELQAGMYLYSLIVDGKEVDTKKMILTD